MITSSSTGHQTTPKPGTARRVRAGQPADLTRPAPYPVTATCLEFGRPIRCERYFPAEWRHVEPES